MAYSSRRCPCRTTDRRDFEIHVKRPFRTSLAVQLKSAIFLAHRFRSYNMLITFTVRKDRLISDPLFWYAMMCLDLPSLGHRDPLFLVNSVDMHRHASPRLVGETWHFEFSANMSPDSKNRWQPSQVTGKNLGSSVLHVLTEAPLKAAPTDATVQELSRLEHLVWVHSRRS